MGETYYLAYFLELRLVVEPMVIVIVIVIVIIHYFPESKTVGNVGVLVAFAPSIVLIKKRYTMREVDRYIDR